MCAAQTVLLVPRVVAGDILVHSALNLFPKGPVICARVSCSTCPDGNCLPANYSLQWDPLVLPSKIHSRRWCTIGSRHPISVRYAWLCNGRRTVPAKVVPLRDIPCRIAGLRCFFFIEVAYQHPHVLAPYVLLT